MVKLVCLQVTKKRKVIFKCTDNHFIFNLHIKHKENKIN